MKETQRFSVAFVSYRKVSVVSHQTFLKTVNNVFDAKVLPNPRGLNQI